MAGRTPLLDASGAGGAFLLGAAGRISYRTYPGAGIS